MRRAIFGGVFAIVGCAGDAKPAPTCQQGLAHYYASGCVYFDATVNPPTPIALSQMVTFCQNVAIQAPSPCQDELDAWLSCNNETPAGATTNQQCDCSAEYMSLLRCK